MISAPVRMSGFGDFSLGDVVSGLTDVGATVGAIKQITGGGGGSSSPAPAQTVVVQAPAPVSVWDAFGPQYRPYVIAGAVGLGALVFVRLVRG